MNDRAWEDLIDVFDERYGLENFNKKTEALADNQKLTQTIETVEFKKDGQTYRIQRVTAPAVIDKKSFYHRTGQATQIQNVYDESEMSHKVTFFKQSTGGEWEEVAPESLAS